MIKNVTIVMLTAFSMLFSHVAFTDAPDDININSVEGANINETKSAGMPNINEVNTMQNTNKDNMQNIPEPKPQFTVQVIKTSENTVQPQVGQTATVHYTGWLYDPTQPENKGKKFDSSIDRGQPFEFKVGVGQVIKGWDEAVAQMHIGENALVTIPADMGYGADGIGNVIPPLATLLFDIELISVR